MHSTTEPALQQTEVEGYKEKENLTVGFRACRWACECVGMWMGMWMWITVKKRRKNKRKEKEKLIV